MQAETVFRNQVHKALSENGFVLFRNNVGVAIERSRCPSCGVNLRDAPVGDDARIIRYGVCNPGGSDLLGYRRIDGLFAAIETKIGRNKLTPEQANFLEQVRKSGGIGVESRNLEKTVYECLHRS